MPPKKGLTGKDAFARMNFLYQASALCSSFSSTNSQQLAAYYGSVFRNVGKKAVLRAEPEIKRTLCKGCSALLIPGDNAKVRLKKKPSPRLIWTCLRCSTLKRFGVRKDYKLWIERDGAVQEIQTYSNSTATNKQKDKSSEASSSSVTIKHEVKSSKDRNCNLSQEKHC